MTILKKNGEFTSLAVMTLSLLRFEAKNSKTETVRVHLKTWRRRKGNNFSLRCGDYDRALELLNYLKVNYSLGNDAPRGGEIGDYIEFNKCEI